MNVKNRELEEKNREINQINQQINQINEERIVVEQNNSRLLKQQDEMNQKLKNQDDTIASMRTTINELYDVIRKNQIVENVECSSKEKLLSLNNKIIIRKYLSSLYSKVMQTLTLSNDIPTQSLLEEFGKSQVVIVNGISKNDVYDCFDWLIVTKSNLNNLFHNNMQELTEPSTVNGWIELIKKEYPIGEHMANTLKEFINNLLKIEHNFIK